MPDHVLIYLNGQRVIVDGDVFRTLVDSCASERGSVAPRLAVEKATAGHALFWSDVLSGGVLRYRTSSSAFRRCISSMERTSSRSKAWRRLRVSARSSKRWSTSRVAVRVLHAGDDRRARGHFRRTSVDSTRSHRSYGESLPLHRILPILEAGLSVDREARSLLGQPISSAQLPPSSAPALPCRSGSSQTGESFFPRSSWMRPLHSATQHADSLIVSGGTETGLARNKRGIEPPTFFPCRESASWGGSNTTGCLSVGANVTWTDLEKFAREELPLVHDLTRRFGSPQIRNAGTLVGKSPTALPSPIRCAFFCHRGRARGGRPGGFDAA